MYFEQFFKIVFPEMKPPMQNFILHFRLISFYEEIIPWSAVSQIVEYPYHVMVCERVEYFCPYAASNTERRTIQINILIYIKNS